MHAASLFTESQDAGGNGTGVFAKPTAAAPPHPQQHSTTGTATVAQPDLRVSAAPVATEASHSSKAAPSADGWATGNGKAVQVSGAAVSRVAGLLDEDFVQNITRAEAVAPSADHAAEVLPQLGRGGGGWITGCGRPVHHAAAAASRYAALFHEVDEVAKLAAAAQPEESSAEMVPEAHTRNTVEQPAGSGGAGCWATGAGKPVPVSAGEAARGKALLHGNAGQGFSFQGASTAAVPDAHPEHANAMRSDDGGLAAAHPAAASHVAVQQAAPPADGSAAQQASGNPWTTGRGSAVSVSAAAAARAAVILDSSGAAALHGQSVPLAAQGGVRQSETESEATCNKTASKSPLQLFVPPVLAKLSPPLRKTGGAALSLHRSALERSARGALAASALPAAKGGRGFRSPLCTLATVQKVCF